MENQREDMLKKLHAALDAQMPQLVQNSEMAHMGAQNVSASWSFANVAETPDYTQTLEALGTLETVLSAQLTRVAALKSGVELLMEG